VRRKRIPWTLLVVKAPSVLLLAGAALSTLSVTRRASALGPVDIEVAAKVGGGTNPENNSHDAGPNPLGFGFGGRAGVSVSGLYAGLSFGYYLGVAKL
jgi:hypothetical protein